MFDFTYWLHFWWMFPIALLICVSVNIVGVSGSVLFIPFYTFIFPFFGYTLAPLQIVQLGLFTETCGYTSSTIAFWRQKLIDGQIARFALLFAVPLAVVGGVLANRIPGSLLLLIVGLALLPLAVLLIRETRLPDDVSIATSTVSVTEDLSYKHKVDRKGRSYVYRVKNDRISLLCASFGGLLQGLVGFSSGELNSAVQILRKTPVRIATGTAHLIIFGASLAAACTHIVILFQDKGSIPWNILVMTIPAVLLGGQIAGLVAGRLPQHIIQMIMGRFLIFIGFLCLYRALTLMNIHLSPWFLLVASILFLVSLAFSFLYKATNRRQSSVVGAFKVRGK
jgi:uncharacterized membrane protein YfcA